MVLSRAVLQVSQMVRISVHGPDLSDVLVPKVTDVLNESRAAPALSRAMVTKGSVIQGRNLSSKPMLEMSKVTDVLNESRAAPALSRTASALSHAMVTKGSVIQRRNLLSKPMLEMSKVFVDTKGLVSVIQTRNFSVKPMFEMSKRRSNQLLVQRRPFSWRPAFKNLKVNLKAKVKDALERVTKIPEHLKKRADGLGGLLRQGLYSRIADHYLGSACFVLSVSGIYCIEYLDMNLEALEEEYKRVLEEEETVSRRFFLYMIVAARKIVVLVRKLKFFKRDEIHVLKGEVEGIKDQVDVQNSMVSELQSKVKVIEDDLQKHKIYNAEVEKRVELEIRDLQSQIDSLKKK